MSPFLGTRGAGSNRAFGYAGAAAPAQVTGLTATDFGTSRAYNDGRIDLSWNAPANNGATISGYLIERSTDGSTYSTLVANTGSSATTYSNTGLLSNQIYYYKVSAINAAGTGLASTAANATSTTVPQAPSITAANVGTGRAYNNGAATITATGGATGGKTISSYTATSSPGSFTATSGSPLTVTGLQSATAYTFSVTATNANGTSTATVSNSITATTVPQAPTIGTATKTSDTTVSLTFTANATGGSGITSYTSVSSPSISLSTSGTSSPLTVTGSYAADTGYTFTIAAVNANGTSTYSSASNSVIPLVSDAVVVTDYSSPYIRAYKFANGWQTAYSNPATLPSGQYNDSLGFSSDRTTVATGGFSALDSYPFTVSSGFGSKYSAAASGGGNYSANTAFANSNVIYAFSNNAGTINAWPFTVGTGPGTKYANISSPPASQYFGQISQNGTAAITTGATTIINAWAFSSASGFGTKYANPATMPSRTVEMAKFNNNTTAIVGFEEVNNPQDNRPLIAYAFSSASGFGTKYSNVIPGSYPRRVFWSRNNDVIAATSNGYSFAAYAFSSGFGTKYTNPAGLPAETYATAWNSSQTIAVFSTRQMTGAKNIIAYPWNNSTGYGTKYADGVNLPSSLNLGDIEWAN